jgi:signal transduction histidine kinase/ligand-binding sensor domain-containing protein
MPVLCAPAGGNGRSVASKAAAACYRVGPMQGPARFIPPAGLRSAVLAVLITAATADAQELPAVTYTMNEGLPNEAVTRLVQDSRGFLWVGGPTALARFDGERFTTYARQDGLDVGTGINDLLIGRQNDLWIATNGAGLFRFDLAGSPAAARFAERQIAPGRAANRVNAVKLAPAGRVWAGTDAGLFSGAFDRGFQRIDLPIAAGQLQDTVHVTSLALDADAFVWIGTTTGLFRCGLAPAAGCAAVARPMHVRALQLDGEHRLWAGTDNGVSVWRVSAAGVLEAAPEVLVPRSGVSRLLAASTGMLAGTEDGRVIDLRAAAPEVLFRSPDGTRINDLVEDAARNIWIATRTALVVLRRQGVTLFTADRGLKHPTVWGMRRAVDGRVYVIAESQWVHRLEGDHLSAVRLDLAPGARRSIWPATAFAVDRQGDLWLGTSGGLHYYRRPPFTPDKAPSIDATRIYTVADGLAGNHVGDIFEDSHGDLWFSSMPVGPDTLTVWRREASRFDVLGTSNGLPPFSQPGLFTEDAHGAMWARLREGGVVRIRNSRAVVFGVEHGFPRLVSAILRDRHGDLWFGGSDRLVKVDDPAADVVRPVVVLDKPGTYVTALAQDRFGTLFVGTFEGLAAIDPVDRRVRRFSVFDGLPRGSVDALAETPDGALIVIVARSIARIAPSSLGRPTRASRCFITSVQVGGRPLSIPDWGVEHLEAPDVPPSQNQVEIEFLGLSERLGEPLVYEYRISGSSEEWRRAANRRVTYAGLAPGRYVFEARAAAADGASVSSVATLAIHVLPPWYRRWWFITGGAGLFVLAGYLAHRARLAQALRTERLRARIATDLHDDIGSSLSQIAILAEVARRRAGSADARVAEPLASIAATSRDLVDAMSDIVWAVNPRTDSLADLTRRMHRFTAETLGGANIALTFSGPPEGVDLQMGADLRREVYLILKESINNVARHSGATRASVDLALVRHELRLTIVDNGRGFDPDAVVDGNGVASMRKRAAAFGGSLTIESTPGRGARVNLVAHV